MTKPELIYNVKLDADNYAQLMALVMVYGTGTGEGGNTLSIEARKALGRPEITTAPMSGKGPLVQYAMRPDNIPPTLRPTSK